MPGRFACFRVTVAKEAGRGVGEDPNNIVEWLEDEWSTLQTKLKNDPSNLRDDMIKFFNELIPGEDDLGDHLYGDYDTFKDRVKLLDDDPMLLFTDTLQIEQIVVKEDENSEESD